MDDGWEQLSGGTMTHVFAAVDRALRFAITYRDDLFARDDVEVLGLDVVAWLYRLLDAA